MIAGDLVATTGQQQVSQITQRANVRFTTIPP
jgi:hypothetical protein